MKPMPVMVWSACLLSLPLLVAPARAQEADAEPGATQPVVLLKLADGRSLWGRIAGHDSERVSFQRLDNGGIVRMPWKQLEPGQSGELLERFGYVDHSSEQLTVEADRLELDDGTEIIGRIVSRTEGEIFVKTAESLLPVPKRRIRGAVTSVNVPAMDIYTRAELYRDEADKLDPASAQGQYDLARFCERILDFQHALEHYKLAQGLQPDLGGGVLPATILRVQDKAQNQAQLDFLYEVDSLRARGRFDDALRALETFAQKWPESSLRNEAERAKKQVLKARDTMLRDLVVKRFKEWARRLIEKQAKTEGATLEASLTYLEDKLKEDILAAVTADLKRAVGASVQPEEIKKMWDERKFFRFDRASYGQGTWLLGEAAALKEYGDPKEKVAEKPKTGAEAERSKIEEKLKRYIANQNIVAKKKAADGPKEGEESEQEKFWRTWNSSGRSQWLLAYFVENVGELRALKEELSNCPDCNGTGTREMINTGNARSNPQGSQGGNNANSAGLVMIDCPMCHRIGRIRRVNFW